MRLRFDSKSMIKGLRRAGWLVGNLCSYALPDGVYRRWMGWRFSMLSAELRRMGEARVAHYVRLPQGVELDPKCEMECGREGTTACLRVGEFKFPFRKKKRQSSYFFDLYKSIRMFDKCRWFAYRFGDISYEVPRPEFVKTRPVVRGEDETSLSVVCKLDAKRHFNFVNDAKQWRDKKDMLVSRNYVKEQPHRTRFLLAALTSPLCDAGQINPDPEHPELQKGYMSMDDQMDYKFIATIEGHDVATNLKWVMSSNSLAVMPRPKVESWFSEGSLQGGVHYVEVKDDYSDLDEKLQYYLDHPQEAERILANAHEYVKQFQHSLLEKWIQHEVVKRYFEKVKSI